VVERVLVRFSMAFMRLSKASPRAGVYSCRDMRRRYLAKAATSA
jgi:hypothetical protein